VSSITSTKNARRGIIGRQTCTTVDNSEAV
jgi:hypothetical protein